jgi:hypothetical protein
VRRRSRHSRVQRVHSAFPVLLLHVAKTSLSRARRCRCGTAVDTAGCSVYTALSLYSCCVLQQLVYHRHTAAGAVPQPMQQGAACAQRIPCVHVACRNS